MKLAPILAQYLFANKRLDLPGIGSFVFEETGFTNEQATDNISFQSNPGARESPDLIAYISAQTGKMKALASADLSSHIELIQQFLNIGKPFLLEGIGNLTKLRSGEYLFSVAEIPTGKLKDQVAKEAVATSATEESFSSYEPLLARKPANSGWKKPALVFLTLIGTGLAIWGGYTVYKRTTNKTESREETSNSLPASVNSDNTTSPVTDSSIATKKDSITNQLPTAIAPAGHFKFVLETAGKTRAFDRYNRLRTFQWNVQMETTDSIRYTLFLRIPSRDTSKTLDSLTALNGRRVYIQM